MQCSTKLSRETGHEAKFLHQLCKQSISEPVGSETSRCSYVLTFTSRLMWVHMRVFFFFFSKPTCFFAAIATTNNTNGDVISVMSIAVSVSHHWQWQHYVIMVVDTIVSSWNYTEKLLNHNPKTAFKENLLILYKSDKNIGACKYEVFRKWTTSELWQPF